VPLYLLFREKDFTSTASSALINVGYCGRGAHDAAMRDPASLAFGGGSKTRQLPAENGRLQVAVRERAEGGSIIKWIELNVHSKSAAPHQ